MYKKQ